MTWTYTLADLTTTTSSGHMTQVRLRIGDTDTNDQLLADEEIYYYLDASSSGVIETSIACCEAIIAEFARQVDKTVGPFSESLSQRIASYRTLIDRLKHSQAEGAYPYAGGISIAAKDERIQDTDRVKPSFYSGMLTNPDRGESGRRPNEFDEDWPT